MVLCLSMAWAFHLAAPKFENDNASSGTNLGGIGVFSYARKMDLAEESYWIFVDLGGEHPIYYVALRWWVRNDNLGGPQPLPRKVRAGAWSARRGRMGLGRKAS
jgi:hypothetical protein